MGAFVLLVTAQALLSFWRAALGARHTRNCQNRLFRSITFSEWIVLLRKKGSDLTHLLTQDVNRIGFAAQQSLRLGGDLIVSAVYLLASLSISVPLSLLAAAGGGLLLLMFRPLNRKSRESGNRLRRSMESLYFKTAEHLAGLKLSKAFARETRALQGFEETTAQAAHEHVYFVRIRSLTQLLYRVGGAVALALFVFSAANWLRMPPAEYVVMIVIFSRLLPRLSSMQQTWQL